MRSGIERRLQQILLLLQTNHDLTEIRVLDVADLLLGLQLHVLNVLRDALEVLQTGGLLADHVKDAGVGAIQLL